MRGRSSLPAERIWDKYVEADNGCWEFIGGVSAGGYGVIRIRGESVFAHRIAYELAVGPIPDGMYVCHACDNPPCINPDHLFVGSPRDNFMDAYAKGRITDRWNSPKNHARHPRGERHGMAKLTDEQAQELIDRLGRGDRQCEVARAFGVSPALVSLIANGKRWAHLNPREDSRAA